MVEKFNTNNMKLITALPSNTTSNNKPAVPPKPQKRISKNEQSNIPNENETDRFIINDDDDEEKTTLTPQNVNDSDKLESGKPFSLTREYARVEEKHANLCMTLTNSIYKKIEEENRQQKLCEPDDLSKAFYCFFEVEKLAQQIHRQVSIEIDERLNEWKQKPYFGDILLKYHHFYKLYKSILQRKTSSDEAIENLKKKPKFTAAIFKIMVFMLLHDQLSVLLE